MIDLYNPSETKFDKSINNFKSWFSFLKNPGSLFYYGVFLLMTAFGYYFFMIIMNGFTSPWSGDYTLQYVPFAYNYYDDWMTFFHTGVFPHWDMNIFLGADTVTSDGYYIMFSPFFWPLLLFPRAWIPQILLLISMMRMLLAGLIFRLYLKKMGVGERFSRLGGIAYAFSGFTAYFMWFNNFLDIVVLFPLVLLGIEYVLKDKRPWLLAIALGLVGIDNFFFFPCTIIITFIYSLIRFFQMSGKQDLKTNMIVLGTGFIGYVLAIGIGGCMLLPGLNTSMTDPKIASGTYLPLLSEAFKAHDFNRVLDLLFSWECVPNGSWHWQPMPIIELFVPPTTCRHITLVNYSTGNTFDNNAGSIWSSMALLFFLLPAFINSIKNKKISHVISIFIVCLALFTPFSYFLLFGGSKAYSRWQLVVPALLIAYVCEYLDQVNKVSLKEIASGYGFVLLGLFASAILGRYYVEYVSVYDRLEFEYWIPFPTIIYIELAYVTVLLIAFIYHYQKGKFKTLFSSLLFVESVAIGTFVAIGHGYSNPAYANGGTFDNANLYNSVLRINNQDDSFYRMYTTLNVKGRSDNNQNMNNYNGVSMFNTLYNFNTRAFKYWNNLGDGSSGWSASYMEKRIGLDYLLGIKYYVCKNNDLKEDEIKSNAYRYNVPFGYEKRSDLSDQYFSVYENRNVNKLGYAFDDVLVYQDDQEIDLLKDVSSSDDYDFSVIRNEGLYLKRAIVSQSNYKALSDDYKIELNAYNDFSKKLSDYGYVRAGIDDDYSYRDPSGFNDYRKSYYFVEDSKNYDINRLGEIPARYPKMTYDQIQTNARNKRGDVFIIIEKKPSESRAFNEEATTFYIDATYAQNRKSDIYLLDEHGDIITFDNHNDDKGFSTNWRSIRAFYAQKPVHKIVIWPRYYGWGDYQFYTETLDTFNNRFNKLSPLENVRYVDSNTFTFETNFKKHKMAVTNIAYEKGWRLFVKDEAGKESELKTFLVDGGFVGFMCPKGKQSYTLNYKNPDFVYAEHFTAISYSIVLASYGAYIFIDNESKRKRSLEEINFHF